MERSETQGAVPTWQIVTANLPPARKESLIAATTPSDCLDASLSCCYCETQLSTSFWLGETSQPSIPATQPRPLLRASTRWLIIIAIIYQDQECLIFVPIIIKLDPWHPWINSQFLTLSPYLSPFLRDPWINVPLRRPH